MNECLFNLHTQASVDAMEYVGNRELNSLFISPT